MAERTSNGPVVVEGHDGQLINGEPILTVETLGDWCRDVYAPQLTEAGALAIAQALNDLKLQRALWHPSFAAHRRSAPSRQRLRRIAEAVEVLCSNLPLAIADTRRVEPNAPKLPIEELLEIANTIAPTTARFLPRKGRAPDPANNVATNIGKLADEDWAAASPTSPPPSAKARAAFVAQAMKWLGAPKTDQSIDKARRRKSGSRTKSTGNRSENSGRPTPRPGVL